MKKGLKIVLEQLRPPRVTPTTNDSDNQLSNRGSTSPKDSVNSTSSVEDEQSIGGQSSQTDLTDKIAGLMRSVDFYSGQSDTPIRFDEKDALNSVSAMLLRLQQNKRLTNENIDDFFVQYMVKYLVSKKKHPLYFEYDPNFFNIEFMNIMENNFHVGLESLLIESRVIIKEQVGNLRGYVQYRPGSSQFAIVSSDLNNNDLEKVKSAYVRKTQKPVELEQKPQTQQQTPQAQQQGQQTPEQPEKRPEEEVGLSGEQIQKKASVEGWAGIKNILSDSKYQGVKTAIENKMREDYVLTFPGDETIDSYEVVDLVKLNPTVFKGLGFTSLPMYRMKKRSGDEILQNLNNIIESGRVTKDFCKTVTKSFYELATDDYAIDINNLKATALYLDRCRDQHGGKWGIGDVEFVEGKLRRSGTDYRLDRMSSFSPEFRINWSDNTVSGQKFK
jgi:hypothetical protein